MSHFAVLVIGDDYEEQLRPYDENIAVEPYKAYWDSDDHKRWEEILADKADGGLPKPVGENSIEDVVAAFNARYGDEEGERIHVDEGGIYKWSSYNPKSRWDWYTIGGRWRGYFKIKNDAKTFAHAQVGDPGVFDNEPEYDADVLYKGDVDAEGMRNEAGEKAGVRWDLAQEIFGRTKKALPWTHFVGQVKLAEAGEGEPYTIEQARRDYHAQTRVKRAEAHDQEARAANDYDNMLLGWSGDVTEYQVSREDYVERARNRALTPYAYVIDGEWHAPGKMGWWGISTDEEADRVRFDQEFNELFDSLPDDTLLHLCDCHI